MTTLRQIITDAYRESGIIAVGTSPEAEEHEEGLRRLLVILRSLMGFEMGEGFQSFLYGTDNLSAEGKSYDVSSYLQGRHIPGNARLVFNIDTAQTLYLDPRPQDGARLSIIDNAGTFDTANVTLDGNGHAIENSASVTLSTANLNREWFYRADLGTWVRVTELTANDESPFPTEFDDLLITMLAVRINPRYGASIIPETAAAMRRSKSQFQARYRQKQFVGSELALVRLPSNYRYRVQYGNEFDYGTL